MLHCFHDYGDINFCLHLQVEARLAHIALLVWAESLLTFKGADIDFETQLGQLFVELLTMPNGRFTSLGSHVVHVIKARIGQLLHVLNNDTHRLRIHHQLALSPLLKRLGALKQICCIHYQDVLVTLIALFYYFTCHFLFY